MTTARRHPYLLICLICFGLAQPFAALAQRNVPASLPPAAQEAVDEGIIAAKVPDYLLAIRYFEEARKLAPEAPVIYLNLGLAESGVPGRELRAMAWFGAYLAAYPDAPNVPAVRKQIGVLQVRNTSNISRLIKTVQDAADQLPDNDWALRDVAALWAGTGDIAGARKTTDRIRHPLLNSQALVIVAEAQIKAGDLAGAKKTLATALKSAKSFRIDSDPDFGLLGPEYSKNSQLASVAIAQAEGRDIAGAQKTFDLIGNVRHKNHYQAQFAKAQAQAGVISAPNSPRHPAQDTQPAVQPFISVSDWLKKLDDDNKGNDCPLNTGPFLCPLNTGPFLDLAGYLKKKVPPSSFGAHSVFGPLLEVAEKIVGMQHVITEMLERQKNP